MIKLLGTALLPGAFFLFGWCFLIVLYLSAVKEILKLCPAQVLVTLYKVPSFETVDDFLYNVATVRGRLKKGGIVDVDAAARIVLHDWNEGKLK